MNFFDSRFRAGSKYFEPIAFFSAIGGHRKTMGLNIKIQRFLFFSESDSDDSGGLYAFEESFKHRVDRSDETFELTMYSFSSHNFEMKRERI